MEKNKMNRNDKARLLYERVSDGIDEVFKSDNFKNYLKVMSRFHTYSARNSLLILMTNPNATLVAGYKAWVKNFNRYVKKGEKGIPIFAYSPVTCIENKERSDETGNTVIEQTEREVSAYKIVHVYDIAQTDGTPLPNVAKELNSSVYNYSLLLNSIRRISPFSISFETLDRVKGYCDPDKRQIVVNKGMSEAQTLKTLVHEIVHALNHSKAIDSFMDDRNRTEEEVEAECTAFVVLEHYGIDTKDYSFPYIAAWSNGKDSYDLMEVCKRIQVLADDMISKIDTVSKSLSR